MMLLGRALPAGYPVVAHGLQQPARLLLVAVWQPVTAGFCPCSGRSALCVLFRWPARPPEVSHASPPPSTCRIYVQGLRAAFGLQLVLQPRPPCPPDAVPVRQARGLPPTSFRFRLATDTLALSCALPAAGRARDFHPLETCACSAHKKQANHFTWLA